MIDYITCIGKYFQTVFVSCIGDPTIYENIIWESGDPLPDQATIDAKRFRDYQDSAINNLSVICENVIMDGFTSNALGQTYAYASSTLDQINIIGSSIASLLAIADPNSGAPSSIPYKCALVTNGVIGTYGYQIHTSMQILSVFMAGVQYKLTQLTNYQTKQVYINSCTTTEQIDAVTWTSTP